MKRNISTVVLLALLLGCSNQTKVDSTKKDKASNAKKTTSQLPALDSFTVTVPSSPGWETLQKGPHPANKDAYVFALANIDKQIQLSVIVLPVDPESPTLDDIVPGWERGFLKKATRKKSGEYVKLSGRRAYKLTAFLDSGADVKLDVSAIITVANGWNFNVAINAPEGTAANDPEIAKFIESFKIVDR